MIIALCGIYSVSSQAEVRSFKYKTGQVRATANYADYVKNGEEIWYYKSGARKSVVNYVGGLKQGYKYIYKQNGDLKLKKLYKDNFIIKMAKTYSEAKRDTCTAKYPKTKGDDLNYKKCELAVDELVGNHRDDARVIPVLNELKSIYKK